MVGAQQRWRELRAQGAQIDAAARAELPRRRLEAVPEATSATKKPLAKKPLGLVWVLSPSYSITTEGLKKVLEGKAEVRIGGQSCAGSPSCVVLYAGRLQEGCLEGMGRIRELYPGVPLLVLGSQLDLGLASSALKDGADGFVHAMMHPAQVLRAVEVVQKGELAAPRQLLRWYFLSQKENPKIGGLSARQREILEMVVEGLSNAQIAWRLYLSESTIKQHLRAPSTRSWGCATGHRRPKRCGSTLEASKGAPKPSVRDDRTLSFLALIHPSAWKRNSPTFIS